MKKKTDFQPGQLPYRKKRPFRQRFISKLLCLCLIGAALPIEYYSFPVLAAQEQTDPAAEAPSDGLENTNDAENPETSSESNLNADGTQNQNPENPTTDSENNSADEDEKSPVDEIESDNGSNLSVETDSENKDTPAGENASSDDSENTGNPENANGDSNDSSLPDSQVDTDPDSDASEDSDGSDSDIGKDSEDPSDVGNHTENSLSDNTAEKDVIPRSGYPMVEFYSGHNEKEGPFEAFIPDVDFGTGKYTAPSLKTIDGWTASGWLADTYTDWIHERIHANPEGDILFLTKDTKYYGLYRTEISLDYYTVPGGSSLGVYVDQYYILVHPTEIEHAPPIYTIREAPNAPVGYTFAGWNTSPDGSGATCQPGDTFQPAEDLSLNPQKVYSLYALFTKPVTLTLYSGQAGQADTVSLTTSNLAEAAYPLPAPEAMEGWTPVGWSKSPTGYDIDYPIGETVELDADLTLYGVYEKKVTLTYDANGIGTAPAADTKTFYAKVNDNSVSRSEQLFSIAAALTNDPDTGASFEGWNTRPDELGDSITPGTLKNLDSDLTLYAIWYLPNSAAYHVEHYLQDAEGEGYTKSDQDTQRFRGTIGKEATASPKTIDGFIENTTHPSRVISGTIADDNSLVLCLYYDRYVVDVEFDLNGGSGDIPDSQSLRQGSFLQKPADPFKDGYNFMGWYLDAEGTKGNQWDFGQTVENNTMDTKVTLYAKWEDLTAPVLGEAKISSGYKGLFHWIIRKKGVTITVPIAESGSGIREANYILIPENGTEKTGNALITTIHDDTNVTPDAQKIRIRIIDGQTAAQFTVDEEFKGAIAMTCTDNNGNVSPRKILTAEDGGIIVEDNAPEINFSAVSGGLTEGTTSIDVSVADDWNGNLSGGIGQISYWVDEQETAFPEELFTKEILESYSFTVDLSGEGAHTLTVTAIDNAGNENTRQITVNIRQPEPGVPGTPGGSDGSSPGGPDGGLGGSGNQLPDNWNPGKPGIYNDFDYPASTGNDAPGMIDPTFTDSKNLPREPRTGELTHVEIYATISMIAGFSYLLLYFTDGLNMTERKKNQLVSRLVRWANSGSRFRRVPALIAIFCLLAYYHSIGKYDEWEVGFWNLNGLSAR